MDNTANPDNSVPSVPSLVVRELEPTEWDRLLTCEGLPCDANGNRYIPSPDTARVIIAELGDEIVGLWTTILVPHCEGFWIREDQRKKSRLPVLLVKEMARLLVSCSVPAAFCWSDRQEIADYLTRLGEMFHGAVSRFPVDTFLFEPATCLSQSPRHTSTPPSLPTPGAN